MATIKTTTSMSTLRTAATQLKKHLAKADGNGDGRISEAEVKKYAKALPNGKAVGEAMLTMTSWALKQQVRGTTVSVKGVTKAVDDALTGIKTRDANRNGKIDAGRELTRANELKTFQALAGLAGALDVVPSTGKLTAAKLGQALKPFFKDANYSSESDYAPIYVTGALSAGQGITRASVLAALKKPIGDFMKVDADISDLFHNGDLTGGVLEEVSDPKGFISFLEEYHPDEDPNFQPSPEAFKKIDALMKQHLTDVKVFKFGQQDSDNPREVDGSPGLCCYLVVGKTADGQVAGMLLGSVET